MLQEVDELFDIVDPMEDDGDDSRSPRHTRHAVILRAAPSALGSFLNLIPRVPDAPASSTPGL